VAVVVIAAIATFVLLGGSSADEKQNTTVTEDGKELLVIRAWTHPGTDSTPYLVGDQLGFFEEEGLKVEYTGVIGSDQYLPSVLDGTNDVGDAHPTELAAYIKEGAPVKAVVRMDADAVEEEFAEHRHMRFYVRNDSPIHDWEDLRTFNNGGEVLISGIEPACLSFVPFSIFDRFDLDRTRIKLVYFGDKEALQALDQGAIDIAQVHAAVYALADRTGYRLIGDSVDAGVGAASGTALYYFTEDFIAEHPDSVQAFVNAITKAQRWIDDPANFEEGARITAEALGTEVAFTHHFSDSTEIIDKDIQYWIDELVRGGYLKENELTVSDLVTHDFYNPVVG
jgi:ABC-type nitrate/sulfonate/bicarbonate transport system substrate-binding protein